MIKLIVFIAVIISILFLVILKVYRDVKSINAETAKIEEEAVKSVEADPENKRIAYLSAAEMRELFQKGSVKVDGEDMPIVLETKWKK